MKVINKMMKYNLLSGCLCVDKITRQSDQNIPLQVNPNRMFQEAVYLPDGIKTWLNVLIKLVPKL